jgi:uncharacterized circularly permuted ATP-grasp superfamily protein/uncharacterized alpha-E superfamily protein
MTMVSPSASEAGFVRGYAPRHGRFDEVVDADARVRPPWRKLLDHLDGLGPAELAHRWERARQLIHENGVSYNVYGDPRGYERPWNLSLLPIVLGSDDWAALAHGLEQRARLLAALVADLYGPQRSLVEGWLPPELVFANPSFLRPLHGLSLLPHEWLTVFGADLVRAPDGSFQVVDDRVQAPTGAGYALENRIVIGSALPEAFRECNVEPLAPFFRVLREVLQARAPHDRDSPRIVLLTPGPSDATYFEQAYLAQYLGLTLASGGDLTVRDDRVFLKTLGGLQPVDVILRRLADDSCDPLDLRADSFSGVPGLVHAVRARNVAVANALGTGVVQTTAILPYLGAISRGLLGEPLALPSVETWWCGDAAALAQVLARFDELVIRPAFPDDPMVPVLTAALSASARAELRERVRARPSAYVAQAYVAPSTTPLLGDDGITPRPLVLRCYAVATGPRDYLAMPGGLGRVAEREGGAEVSMQRDARAKDVWVLSNEAVAAASLTPARERPVALSRGRSELPSRVADNLFWLGRYAERAEAIARLCRVVGARIGELAGQKELDRSSEFGALLGALQAQIRFLYSADIPLVGAPNLADAETQLVAAVCDGNNVGSLTAVVRSMRHSAGLVRDRLSLDTWRVLATLDEEIVRLERIGSPNPLGAIVDLLNRVVIALAAFSGLAMESMTRGQAWRFLDVGRRLERAVSLLTLLRSTVVEPSGDREHPLLEAVLEIADSGMTYRRRYLATLQTPPVVDLLVTDDGNPRSVLFQVRALVEHVRALPPLPGSGVLPPQLRLALSAQHELELAEIERICQPDERGRRPALAALLRGLGTTLPALSESLSNGYLSHATVTRHLTQDDPRNGQGRPRGGAGEP